MNEHDSETIAGMLEEEGCRQVLTKRRVGYHDHQYLQHP